MHVQKIYPSGTPSRPQVVARSIRSLTHNFSSAVPPPSALASVLWFYTADLRFGSSPTTSLMAPQIKPISPQACGRYGLECSMTTTSHLVCGLYMIHAISALYPEGRLLPPLHEDQNLGWRSCKCRTFDLVISELRSLTTDYNLADCAGIYWYTIPTASVAKKQFFVSLCRGSALITSTAVLYRTFYDLLMSKAEDTSTAPYLFPPTEIVVPGTRRPRPALPRNCLRLVNNTLFSPLSTPLFHAS